jgi:hypothetical protein
LWHIKGFHTPGATKAPHSWALACTAGASTSRQINFWMYLMVFKLIKMKNFAQIYKNN